jgi:hypothetical protein
MRGIRGIRLTRFLLSTSLLAQATVGISPCFRTRIPQLETAAFIGHSPLVRLLSGAGEGSKQRLSHTSQQPSRNTHVSEKPENSKAASTRKGRTRGIAALRALDAGIQDDEDGSKTSNVRDATLRWVDRVVVGLNLCPWANSVLQSGSIRVVVSPADTEEDLLQDVIKELKLLANVPMPTEGVNATTLVVTEKLLGDFVIDYNPFAQWVDDGEIIFCFLRSDNWMMCVVETIYVKRTLTTSPVMHRMSTFVL